MTSVLYVEDDEITAFITKHYFAGWDFEVAADAEVGLELADTKYFPVIMLDINLGDGKMTGTQAMKLLRKRPEFGDTVFVAVTAYTEDYDRERLLNEGFDAYFPKPIDYEGLTAYLGSRF